MKPSPRLFAFFAIVAALVAVVAVVGNSGGVFSTGDRLPPRRGVDLIAYVDPSGQIHTIQPDDTSIQRTISPEEGFFTWPVWSPDATRIAFSGVRPGISGPAPLTLFASRSDGSELRTIYTNQPGMGAILGGMPHYPIWSPDSSRIAFMASSPQGLTLFLHDLAEGKDADVVLRNSPLYASWSADSRYMLVHGGTDHFLVDAETGAFVGDLTRRSFGYRAPAWWPSDRSKVALVYWEEGEQGLFVTDVESGERTMIARVPVSAAFLWSPDGQSLAVAKSDMPEGFLFDTVSIFSPSGARSPVEVQGNVAAYFWSPDSTKLAYIVLTRTRGVVRLMVLDTRSGDKWPLVEFTPTPDQATVYNFFDQFAHSHSPWSPDSKSLVFAGRLRGQGVSVSLGQQTTPHIYIVDATPQPRVRAIAEGFLAFWSPR